MTTEQTEGKAPLAYRIRNGIVSALAAGAVLATGNVYSQLPLTTATEQTIQKIQVQREQERKQKDEAESRLKLENYKVNLQQARDLFNKAVIIGKISIREANNIRYTYDRCSEFTNSLPKEDSNLYKIVKDFSEDNNYSRMESRFKEQGINLEYDKSLDNLIAGAGLAVVCGLGIFAAAWATTRRKTK